MRKICGKAFSKSDIKSHIWRTHTKEGQSFKANNENRTVWNKGLNKSDLRVQKYTKSASRSKRQSVIDGCGVGFCSNSFQDFMKTEEYRNEQSKRIKEVVLQHRNSYSSQNVSGRYKSFEKEYFGQIMVFKGT